MQQTSLFPCFVLAAKSGPLSIWNHYPSLEEAEAARQRLPRDSAEGGPDGYEVLSLEAFLERERASCRMAMGGLEPIGSDEWDYCLEMLPPVQWERAEGVERFLCAEFLNGRFTRQYARRGTACFTAIVDVEDVSTWITATMIDDHLRRTESR